MQRGHTVLALSRSASKASHLSSLPGVEILEGSTENAGLMQKAATECDGVLHLAYNHDFSIDRQIAATQDEAVIESFARALEGSNKPFVIASGTLIEPDMSTAGKASGKTIYESTMPAKLEQRSVAMDMTLKLKEKGIRSGVIRFAPSVHGAGDKGFINIIAQSAKRAGKVPYCGQGANRWNTVHVDDAAALVALVMEKIEPGTVVHAIGESAVPFKAIAEAISERLGVPANSTSVEEVIKIVPGFIGMAAVLDLPAESTETQKTFGWKPTGPGIVDDILENYKFD